MYEDSNAPLNFKSLAFSGIHMRHNTCNTLRLCRVTTNVYFFFIYGQTSVFLKVELACNGLLPVRILGSNLRPSKIYDVANQPSTEEWDLVRECNLVLSEV